MSFLSLLPYISRSLLADSASPTLTGFLVFAAGFAARPVGGLIFGALSDRGSTRLALRGSVALGACATIAVALVPETGGYWTAPALLLVSRLLLGVAHGGVGSVANGLSYDLHTRTRSRTFEPTVLVYSMAAMGKCVSILLTLVVATIAGHSAMTSWGWRLPFAFGALMAVVVLLRIPPQSEFPAPVVVPRSTRTGGIGRTALVKRMLTVVALTAGTTAAYNVWIAGAIPIAVAHFRISERAILAVTLLQTIAFAALVLACGRLIRRWSLRGLYLRAATAMVATCVPALFLTSPYVAESPIGYIIGVTLATLTLSGLCAALPGVVASLFPANVRSAGSGVPYAIAVALIGGTAPGLREFLDANYIWFAAYVFALCVVTAVAAAAAARTWQPENRLTVNASSRRATTGSDYLNYP